MKLPRALPDLRSDGLLNCRFGASIVEFALLAPVFIAMLFAIVEGGRMFWMKQTLDEVAYNTARCMSVSSECGTTANQKNHAVQRAAGYGLAINLENVEIVPNAPCKGYPGSNSVTVSMAFNSPASGLLPLPAVLQAHACYPVLS